MCADLTSFRLPKLVTKSPYVITTGLFEAMLHTFKGAFCNWFYGYLNFIHIASSPRTVPSNGQELGLHCKMGMQFEYDEKGGTFYYFLLSFLALILLPVTFYLWPRSKPKGKKNFGEYSLNIALEWTRHQT